MGDEFSVIFFLKVLTEEAVIAEAGGLFQYLTTLSELRDISR